MKKYKDICETFLIYSINEFEKKMQFGDVINCFVYFTSSPSRGLTLSAIFTELQIKYYFFKSLNYFFLLMTAKCS